MMWNMKGETMSQTQAGRLKSMFAARPKEWIPLPEILKMGIAQYNARIFDLRKARMIIINKTKTIDGEVHSWFMYEPNEVQQELFQNNA